MIIRIEKSNRYAVIANAVLQDERLSYAARGIAASLLSRPDGWRIREEHLVSASPDSRGCVHSAMNELRTCGYLHRRRYQSRPGGTMRHDVTLYEEPHVCACDNPACLNWHGDAPNVDAPTAEIPTVGIPTVGNTAVIENPEKQIQRERDPGSGFLSEGERQLVATTSANSTPPTIATPELSSQQPTATASSQQAEIDACLLAYNDAGGRTMSEAELRIFTTTVRTAGPRAMLDAIDVAAVQAEKGKDTLHVHYIRKIAENLAAGTAAPTRPATRHRNHATTNWPAIAAEHNRTAALEVTPTDDGDANRAEVHAIAERLLGGSGQYWDVLRTAVDAGMDRHGAAAVRDALEFAKATTPGKFDRRALRNVLATVPVRVPA